MSPPRETKKRRRLSDRALLYMGAGAMALIVALALLFAFTPLGDGGDDLPAVLLPSGASDPGPVIEAAEIDRVSVKPDTVQAVIATLAEEKATAYSRTASAASYWDGGSAVSAVSGFVSGSRARISARSGEETRNVLIDGDELFIWYDGEGSVYRGALADGALTEADRFQGLMSYEEILSLDVAAILDAGYTSINGESCVYAKYAGGSLGYATSVYISVSSGLLWAAEVTDGDETVYAMAVESITVGEPEEGVFTRP